MGDRCPDTVTPNLMLILAHHIIILLQYLSTSFPHEVTKFKKNYRIYKKIIM